MNLKALSLVNYKNIESKHLEFDPKINCFVGKNGVGKTNILDAIYHLSFGKSYFNPITSQNIRHSTDFFMVEGLYHRDHREEKVVVSVKKGQKKIIKRNGKNYDKLSDHIGFLPLVIISPADNDLIIEGSTTRRKFMDGVLSQTDSNYLSLLLNYNKTLAQRNALLKYFAANHTFDNANLSIYNEQLHQLGTEIYNKRKSFINSFIPIFKERYQHIAANKEQINLTYQSKIHDTTILNLLTQNLPKDRVLQHTSVGIHKDDLDFSIEGYPIKKFGSQGQQKSFLIALKLAQFDFILQQSDDTPILLLDDIFDKLDESRVEQLMKLVDDNHFGQLFVSDTHTERTEAIVKKISQSYKIFELT
ncbi:DNA replication/repair protein RecF [Aquimarina agarilytica]|uniref:DNA replication/repair protein RecF n=1 Tax=Aquimarina agarilytica TaxID=1087449 RepID=UPI0002887A6A|nr:DNA replication/repair protein RecF [Aquimarina agarilytica]